MQGKKGMHITYERFNQANGVCVLLSIANFKTVSDSGS